MCLSLRLCVLTGRQGQKCQRRQKSQTCQRCRGGTGNEKAKMRDEPLTADRRRQMVRDGLQC